MSKARVDIRRVRSRLATGVATAVALSASPGARAATVDDACSLLSTAEVAASLGVEVDAGTHPVAGDQTFCDWREKNKPEGPARNVILTIIDATRYDGGKTAARGVRVAAAKDLGDEAYWLKAGRFPINLTVRKGDFYFKIMARTAVTPVNGAATGDEQNVVAEKMLAAVVMKKL